MSPQPEPAAPLWRRLAAAAYDALLLTGIWMVALLLDIVVRDLLDLPRNWPALRAYLFVVGLGFFGWFWTHGGQTLGMRAWRLKLKRADGSALSWPVASARYAVAWVSWGALLAGMLWCLVDRRGRAWHDLVAGTEVIVLPKAA